MRGYFLQSRFAQRCDVANARSDSLIVYSLVAVACQDYPPNGNFDVSWPTEADCVLQTTQVDANIRLAFPSRVSPES
jgi:hypothetical protein